MSKCQYCGLEFRNLDPRHLEVCKEQETPADNKAPRALFANNLSANPDEGFAVVLKEHYDKLQLRLERCEALLRESGKSWCQDDSDLDAIKKYFEEVEGE